MDRRQLITGLISLIAAPAIVRAGSLMPVKSILFPTKDPLAKLVHTVSVEFDDDARDGYRLFIGEWEWKDPLGAGRYTLPPAWISRDRNLT